MVQYIVQHDFKVIENPRTYKENVSLEQNTGAYQCKILILLQQKQHNSVYCMFYPVTV